MELDDSILTLDSFMTHLRELPEFSNWNDEQFQDLYANDYLPAMQAQQAPQRRGILGSVAPPAGPSSASLSTDVNGIPVDLRFQPQGMSVGASALLHSGRDDALSAHGTKSLLDKGWNVGIQYQKRF